MMGQSLLLGQAALLLGERTQLLRLPRIAWTSRTAGTERSCGERRGDVAGGARGRGRCAKKETHRSLLRGQTARPLGRATTPPALLRDVGDGVGWDEAEQQGAARRGSWRSERARHVREEGSALFSASRAGGRSLGVSERASFAFRVTWATG